ncbi:MAG: bifunctional phosphoribosyl-AMP cyclohydrolase/phosphoribosyl-ATP diphosphatase HisIE [Myxococcales bacterium]
MADREPVAPSAVAFDARGLVPAVVQDARTGEVLMLAWQNAQALQQTLATGKATFFSRSRDALWVKGETSGNTQAVRAVATDCDQDAILLQVDPAGPACHTGERSCFFRGVEGTPVAGPTPPGPRTPGEILAGLERVLRARREAPPAGSYTAKLFADEALRHKKVGEEATELVVASLRGNKEEIAWEAADLVYHTLVLLQAHGMGMAELAAALETREGKRRAPPPSP